MSFPRYPGYKDSGVDWLGQVPEHWGIDRIKRSTISAKNGVWGDEAKQDVNDIPCVRVADFDRQALRVELNEPTLRNVVDSDRVGRVLVQGDLLLEKSGGGEGQPVGCVVLYDDPRPAVCSNFVARVQTAPGMDSSFWRYVHAAAYAVRLNTRSIKQTSGIQNLDASQYFDERAGFPPVPEQTQIATFLDRETAKIDDLVAEQRRLVELLKEKRQALISHAVTKGLNPNAPMKPSGIEWMGDVPAHWGVTKLSRITTKIGDGLHGTPDYVDESEFYFINGNNLASGAISITNATRCVSETERDKHRVELNQNTVLLSINGTIGNFALYRGESVMLGKSAAYINCNEKVLRNYLCWCVQSSGTRRYFDFSVTGTTIYNLSLDSIRKMPVALPSVDEQDAICTFLAERAEEYEGLQLEAQRVIDLLHERRTALISAAVTGQIDVKRAAEKLST